MQAQAYSAIEWPSAEGPVADSFASQIHPVVHSQEHHAAPEEAKNMPPEQTADAVLELIERKLTCDISQTLWALCMRTSAIRAETESSKSKSALTHGLASEAYEAVQECASALREILNRQVPWVVGIQTQ